MKLKNCPNCNTPLEGQDLDETPHCPGCGANLLAKKYQKADDPVTVKKELEETKKRLAKVEADTEATKKLLQEKEDKENERDNKPRRTLFGS
jgi:DNA-directed RNA polymerase subunit RPC12/RpoP